MKQWLISCAISAALLGVPTGAAAQDFAANGSFAAAGRCIWSPRPRSTDAESAGGVILGQVATQLVKSFATALADAAKGRTQASTAAVLIRPGTECIQFVRGSVDLTTNLSTLSGNLITWNYAADDTEATRIAQTLLANGLPLSLRPALLVEARLRDVHLTGADRIVVLDPSYIGYNDPSFTQPLRFWDGGGRTFAMQLQAVAAPSAPADNSAGGQVQLGRHSPRARVRLVPETWTRPSPRASYAFELKGNAIYNARVSVSESTTSSAFLQFWANVMSNSEVQTAVSREVNLVINDEARDAAQGAAATAYNTARTTLATLVSTCPVATAAQADRETWVRTKRGDLIAAISGFNTAAGNTDPRRARITMFAEDAGPDAIIAWCDQARTFLLTH